jgi:ribonuclease Z
VGLAPVHRAVHVGQLVAQDRAGAGAVFDYIRETPMLRLTFLGTSAAQPTIRRNLSGLAVRREGELALVDCGEGTQRQLITFGAGFDVAAIFFTHFHADHYLGAIGFLRTLSMQGRTEPLDVYGPRPARRLLDTMLFTGTDRFGFEVRIHEVQPGEPVVRGACRWIPFATDHRTPSVGWSLVEDPRPGRFHPEKAAALGVPRGPAWGALQRGAPVTLEGGRVVRPEEVVEAPRRGRTVSSRATRAPAPPPSRARAARTSSCTRPPSGKTSRPAPSRPCTPPPARRRGSPARRAWRASC